MQQANGFRRYTQKNIRVLSCLFIGEALGIQSKALVATVFGNPCHHDWPCAESRSPEFSDESDLPASWQATYFTFRESHWDAGSSVYIRPTDVRCLNSKLVPNSNRTPRRPQLPTCRPTHHNTPRCRFCSQRPHLCPQKPTEQGVEYSQQQLGF
jgi:hypothetical protein